MKYMAHMQGGQYAEGLDGDALDTFLSNRAVDALAETGLIAIWFEES